MDYKIDVIEKERNKRLKVFKIMALISLGLLIVTIILFTIYSFQKNETLLTVSILFALITLVIFIISFAIPSSGYDKFVKENLEHAIMCDVFKANQFNYEEKNGISFNEMNCAGIFRRPDEFETSDTIRTSYKGVQLVLSDYIFTRITRSVDSKGNTTTHHYPYPGRYMSFTINRDFKSGIAVIDKRNNNDVIVTRPFKNSVDFESIEFNKKFYLTTTDKEKAFYLIRPKEIMDLLDLSKMYKGKIVCVIINHTIYFILADTSVSFEFSLFKKINQEKIQDIYAYYELPLKIIDTLKLDSDRFNAKELDGK
jgi:hypothetical protein